MEWPYSPLEEESLYGLLSPHLEMENKSSQWTYEENKAFENCLAEINPASPNFFEKVASKIPLKSIEQIKNHYQALVEDVEMIESGNFPIPDYSNHDSVEEKEKENDQMEAKRHEGSPPEITKMRNNGGQRRRGVPWTEEEHQFRRCQIFALQWNLKKFKRNLNMLFLMGLNKYGKGDWRSISRYYVITKTPTQVASHAQKYFRRQTSSTPIDRRRPSIHDIQTVNPTTTFSTPSLPQISHGNSVLSINSMLNQSFNGGIQVQQNPNFNLPMNPNFASAEGPIFNQSGSADFTTSFLFPSPGNQQWG